MYITETVSTLFSSNGYRCLPTSSSLPFVREVFKIILGRKKDSEAIEVGKISTNTQQEAKYTAEKGLWYVCMHACMYVCMYVWKYMSISIFSYQCGLSIHTYINTYILPYIHTYIHTYIHIYIHTHIHTYIHTYIHTWQSSLCLC